MNTILLIKPNQSNETLLHVVDQPALRFHKENKYFLFMELGQSKVVEQGVYSLNNLPFNFVFRVYKKCSEDDRWRYDIYPAEQILFDGLGKPVLCGFNDECSNHIFTKLNFRHMRFYLDEACEEVDEMQRIENKFQKKETM